MCYACKEGTVYNNYTRECQVCPPGSKVSPDATICLCNSIYQTFSFASNTCQCPANTPVLTSDEKCTTCNGYYDAIKQICVDCPVGSNMVKDPSTGICSCPNNMPLYVGGACRVCANSSYYYDLNT